MSMKLQKAADISSELRQRRSSRSSGKFQPADDAASRKLSAFGSRRSMAFSDESDTGSGTDYNDDDVCIVKKDPGFRKVKGQEGMYYKVIFLSSIFSESCFGKFFISFKSLDMYQNY